MIKRIKILFHSLTKEFKHCLFCFYGMQIYSILLLIFFTTSCYGQNQTHLPKDSVSTSKTTFTDQPKTKVNTGVTTTYLDGESPITCSLQDKEGNLWFGTFGDGVFRYDGETFTNITQKEGLCNNHIISILEDTSGNLWFGTTDGLCYYDGKTFTHVPIPSYGDGDMGSNSNHVVCLLQDRNGNIWLGTWGGGAYRYDGKSFSSFLANAGKIYDDGRHHNHINSIMEDTLGNIWFTSMSHGGVSRYDGKTFTHFTLKDGLSDDMVISSFQDRAGNIWLGTRDNGLCRYDAASGRFTNYTEADGLIDNCVSGIHEDKSGKLWLVGGRVGECYYDGKTFTPFPSKENKNLNINRILLEDKAGYLWFSGKTNGKNGSLWRYDGKTLTAFTQKAH